MIDAVPEANVPTPNTKLKVIVGLNVVLGLILWFGYFTDFSWAGLLPDLLFPPMVGLVALVSFARLKAISNKNGRNTVRLFSIFSIAGGCLPGCLIAILILPPFTLGFLFMTDEMRNEVLIQRVNSPNETRIAEVYFRGVGAYDAGNGRIYVRVKTRWLPIVEREIYQLDRSYADQTTSNYLQWIDNNTLFLSEEGKEIKVGIVNFELPMPLLMLIFVIRSLGG